MCDAQADKTNGSNTSSSAAFINAVSPAGTIISYGKGNSYGHPHAAVVSRLQKVGSKIYSTAEAGNIVVTTNGKTHSVSVKPWSGVVTPAPTPTPQPKPEPAPQPKPDLGLTVIPGAPTSFQNCTAMKKYYPKGVKNGHPAYATKHDRDKDGWACD
ncbi:excalibur calcium-binding domain-containing protein [Sporosarcina psychrophila]|uniref:excalibur calcium-binding domain-containing protein n=1 Tax=Sporosarcina psychrophila TaxID=1476 RepID=UPI0030D30DBE